MRKIVHNYVRMWESRCYPDGIPDEPPPELFHKIPSYKLIAFAILRNDSEMLGIIKPPCKAYIALKRIEISKRPNKLPVTQLNLFEQKND
jgi:predicted phosphoadenosine phosphosulfate sulfurtransferase